jgi:phytoene dehydrogenase-like protein
MVPKAYYTTTFFSQYFSITTSRNQHGRLKDEMAEKVINKMAEYAPNLKGTAMDKVVFARYHYEIMRRCSALPKGVRFWSYDSGADARMQQARGGVVRIQDLIDNLCLCGACRHAGLGVTALPGYDCGDEVLKVWKKMGGFR